MTTPQDALAAALTEAGELINDLVVSYHQTGSIRDHADPKDRSGWNVKDVSTCGDSLCVASLVWLAALAASGWTLAPVVACPTCGKPPHDFDFANGYPVHAYVGPSVAQPAPDPLREKQRRYAPPCRIDSLCCRNDGHAGTHLYPTAAPARPDVEEEA